MLAVQEPEGLMVKVLWLVTSWRLLAATAQAVEGWLLPSLIVAVDGVSSSRTGGLGITCRVAVTVRSPVVIGRQTLPVQEPPLSMVKVVWSVMTWRLRSEAVAMAV